MVSAKLAVLGLSTKFPWSLVLGLTCLVQTSSSFPSIRAVWESSLQYGDKTYIVYENERYTYRQAHQKVIALANVLKTEYGIQKGDRVAVIMRNYPEWYVKPSLTKLQDSMVC